MELDNQQIEQFCDTDEDDEEIEFNKGLDDEEETINLLKRPGLSQIRITFMISTIRSRRYLKNLTQVLTRYGCFRINIKRFGKAGDDKCPYCGGIQTTTHVILKCERQKDTRECRSYAVGEVINVEGRIEKMLTNGEK